MQNTTNSSSFVTQQKYSKKKKNKIIKPLRNKQTVRKSSNRRKR